MPCFFIFKENVYIKLSLNILKWRKNSWLVICLQQYRDFKIPEEFTAIWDYMERGYQTTAFSATLPSDQDIVKHYEMRAAGKGIKGRPTLQKQTYTMSVPKRVPTTTVNGGGDGEGSNGMDESGE